MSLCPILQHTLAGSTQHLASLREGLAQQGHPSVLLTLDQATASAAQADAATMADSHAVKMLHQLSWEQLHLGHYKDVHMAWRDLYALASLLSASLLLQAKPSQAQSSSTPETPSLTEAMRVLDLGIMMGGPLFREALHASTAHIGALLAERNASTPTHQQQSLPSLPTQEEPQARSIEEEDMRVAEDTETGDAEESSAKRRKGGISSWRASGAVRLPPGSLHLAHEGCCQPPVCHLPPLEDFLLHFMMAPGGGQPAIITGAMESWPAMKKWQDLRYLTQVAGHRTVPVEVGRHYLDDEWGQQLMTLSHFITAHVDAEGSGNGGKTDPSAQEPDAKGRGYLAQHPLFDQIPALAADIQTPEYVSLCADEDEGGGLQSVNAWFGPAGTVTPLHTDPHHNLLAQVVGRKYVRLYAPAHDAALYPFQEGLTTNTSQVDLDAPDHKRFPAARDLPHVDCLLERGQILYVPKGWWHYVRSLSTSFSVSFWFR